MFGKKRGLGKAPVSGAKPKSKSKRVSKKVEVVTKCKNCEGRGLVGYNEEAMTCPVCNGSPIERKLVTIK